jgi:hypothetical protein
MESLEDRGVLPGRHARTVVGNSRNAPAPSADSRRPQLIRALPPLTAVAMSA